MDYVYTQPAVCLRVTQSVQAMHKPLAQGGTGSATLPSWCEQQWLLTAAPAENWGERDISSQAPQLGLFPNPSKAHYKDRRAFSCPSKQSRSIWPGCVSWHVYAGQLLQGRYFKYTPIRNSSICLLYPYIKSQRKQVEVRNWRYRAIFIYL